MSDTSKDEIIVSKVYFGVENINNKDKWALVIQGEFRNEYYAKTGQLPFKGKAQLNLVSENMSVLPTAVRSLTSLALPYKISDTSNNFKNSSSSVQLSTRM